jgi:hypothetical protein
MRKSTTSPENVSIWRFPQQHSGRFPQCLAAVSDSAASNDRQIAGADTGIRPAAPQNLRTLPAAAWLVSERARGFSFGCDAVVKPRIVC